MRMQKPFLLDLLTKNTKDNLLKICQNAYLKLPLGIKYGQKHDLICYMNEQLPVRWRSIFSFFSNELTEEFLAIRKTLFSQNKIITVDLSLLNNMDSTVKWKDIFLSFGIAFQSKEKNEFSSYSLTFPIEAVDVINSFDSYVRTEVFAIYNEILMISKGLIAYYGLLPFNVFYNLLIELLKKGRLDFPVLHEFMHFVGCFNLDWPHINYGMVLHPIIGEKDLILLEKHTKKHLRYKKISYEECMQAAMDSFVFIEPYSGDLISFYLKKGLGVNAARNLAKDLFYDTLIPLENTAEVLKYAIENSLENIFFESMNEAENYLELVFEYLNHSPKWILRGHSPQEIFEKDAMPVSVLDMKVKRIH